MEKAATLVEYGVPIDPQTMVTPPDATELELEPGHPGLGDEAYFAAGRSCSPCAAATGWSGLARRSSPTRRKKRASGGKSARSWTNCTSSTPASSTSRRSASWPSRGKRFRNCALLSERLRRDDEHAPGPGRGGAAVPDLLPVHRRARLSGDAVHPPRLAPGVHARAGHDPRLSRPRPAADEPRLRRTAHRSSARPWRPRRTATRCWP